MISHVTIGTNDLQKASAFYDTLLGTLGAKRAWANDRMIGYAVAPNLPMVAVCKPYDGGAATVGNGMMVSLAVDSKDKVHAVYKTALEAGATDEGAPGPRGGAFYGAYFRDPDGNKLAVFAMGG